MISPLHTLVNVFRGGSIRRQLIVGIALVHAVLMTIFVYDLISRQQAFLEEQMVKQAQSLAATLATNSASWVLADDVIGLEEVVLAQAQYPSLRYAFVVDLSGKVLGHTITDNLGRYVSDPVSVSLLDDNRKQVVLVNDGTTVDAAAEIISGGQRIGWARIALDRRQISQNLEILTRDGVIYTIVAILIGTVFAVFMAMGMTGSLYRLMSVTKVVGEGDLSQRASLNRSDEIGKLAQSTDEMIDALSRAKEEAAIGAARIHDYAETSADWFWESGPDHRLTFVSEDVKERTGFGPEEFVGKLRTELSDEQVSKTDLEEHAKILEAREPFRNFEYGFLRNDGTRIIVQISGKPIFDDSGSFLGYRGTGRDATELITARMVAQGERDRAERANRAKSEFLSNMSHELRTPLNAIMGFSQILAADTKTPLTEKHKDGVQQIIKAGDHLLQLIDQVLDLAKIETGNFDISIENVGVKQLLEDCLSMASTLGARRNIKVSGPPLESANLPMVHADNLRLRQVLLNLLSNAVKYNKDNGEVIVTCEPTNPNMFKIMVTDTGPGIPAHLQEGVFQPFNRLGREAGAIEGTGVGLTITRELIMMMGGRLGFSSTEGRGSSFWFELQIATPEDVSQQLAKAQDDAGKAPKKPKLQKLQNILYVEDNAANVDLMLALVEGLEGCIIKVAHSAEEGLTLVNAQKPDLILMDINLPGMSGVEAVKLLKADPETAAIPVIAVSANAMPDDIEAAMKEGFEDYIVKPFDVAKTMDVLETFLNRD